MVECSTSVPRFIRASARALATAVATLTFAAACVTSSTQTQNGADIVLTGGRVFTGNERQPWAEAVAIQGETISAVGTDAQIRSLAGSGTRVIDLAGRLVIPGINDAHVHAPWVAEKTIAVATPPPPVTKESLLEAIREAAAKAPADATLTAELPRSLVDAGITRTDLDAISSQLPIRLASFGGHSAILNSAALRAWGISEGAANPPGGTYGRDGGRLNGWLYEHAYWLPQIRYARTVSDDRLRTAIRRFEDEMVSYGVTSVQTMSTVSAERLDQLLASSSPRLRWRVIDFRMAPFDDAPGRWPVKYVVDGIPVERTAAMNAPYADDPSARGELNYPLEEIAAMVRDAAAGRRQLLVHLVGDRAIAALFDAMERTPADWPSRRVRVEHGDMVTPELAARARKLGVIFVQNPSHFTIADTMAQRYGSERSAVSQPARSLIEGGNHFALGSDGPLNPYLNMFFASIHPTNPSERLSVEQSLRAYTSGAAYAELEEKRKGTIAAGMAADLAVLSQDIFRISPDELPKTSSVLTIVGGKVVWEAGK